MNFVKKFIARLKFSCKAFAKAWREWSESIPVPILPAPALLDGQVSDTRDFVVRIGESALRFKQGGFAKQYWRTHPGSEYFIDGVSQGRS